MKTISKFNSSAWLLAALALTAVTAPACSSAPSDDASNDAELRGARPIMADVLAGVAPGTKWADLPPKTKKALAHNADVYLARVQHDWGNKGLDEKIARVLQAPTAPMLENFDRVIQFLAVNQVPAAFKASTDITNPALAAELRRLYVVWFAMHRDTALQINPDFKDWDGGPIREILVVSPQTLGQQKAYAADIDAKLRAIPAGELSAVEKAVRDQIYFYSRQLIAGTTGFNFGADDMLQTGTVAGFLTDFSANYKADGSGVISNDEDLLQAYNAFTFVQQEYTNVGTVDSFNWQVPQALDPDTMKSFGFDPATMPVAATYVTLTGWYVERTAALPAATKSCTIYTKAQRASLWNGLTANNLVNADGKTTMESYAASYGAISQGRVLEVKNAALAALDSAFPSGNTLLTATQKTAVTQAVNASTQPAAMLATLTEALDSATGNTNASASFTASMSGITLLGSANYTANDQVSASDAATANAMWEDVKAYVKKHYSGYAVDIASLLPATLKLSTSDSSYTEPPTAASPVAIQIGLGKVWSKAALYSTMLHEGKHAIDFASKAPVQGAAWEGGGVATEDLVQPKFVAEVMAPEGPKLPYYRLNNAIDNVRIIATTDAALKVFLRPHCNAQEPNSIDFAKNIVAGYGYADADTQLLRSRRAHNGTQYLSYSLGEVVYLDLISFLQGQVGAATAVDPYLLQACGLSNANASSTAAAALTACIAAHR